MMIVLAGGNGSGKSRYAEQLAAGIEAPRVYIATMVCSCEENDARIEKHRRQRAGLHFKTLELPTGVDRAELEGNELVLLEDASNLVANLIFAEGKPASQALTEILSLREKCRYLLVVTIGGLEEAGYTGETAAYIRGLNDLNTRLEQAADAVVEMQDGQPMWRKGSIHDLL